MFEVKVKMANLDAPSRTEEISLLVDTRATLSWLPRTVLEKLAVKPLSRLPFLFTDGTEAERDTAAVVIAIGNRKAPVPVAFGEPGEKPILGLTALEALGFALDQVAGKLIPRNLRNCLDERMPTGTNGAFAA